MTIGCCACQGSSKSAGHAATQVGDSQAPRDNTEQLEVLVLYREQMMLPSTATVTVTMEEVPKKYAASIWSNPTDERWRSRGLVKTIGERTVRVEGGPPHIVTITYDPSGLSAEGSYTVRARIENANELLFTNAAYTQAFGANGSTEASPNQQPIEILVQRVLRADEQQP
jgi:uncharacterized lipoprotein YbaY